MRASFTLLALPLLFIGIGTSITDASQILWGSARLAKNYLSSGDPAILNKDFTFQLGAFKDGFVPTQNNTAEWLAHWVPAQSKRYNDQTHFFTGSHVYQTNQSPFLPSNRGYIFGFNRWAVSEGGARAEWILATDPAWRWPAGSAIAPPVQWSMSKASEVILGSVGGTSASFHMMTADIATPLQTLSAEQWARRYLGGNTDFVLAGDPDHDGLSNRMEFFFSTDPLKPDHGRYPTTELVSENGQQFLQLAFFKFGQMPGTALGVEISKNLSDWEPAGDSFRVLEDSILVYRVRSREPVAAQADLYFRLTVSVVAE